VPKEYAERLLATRGQVSPERRTVTLLFSDVKGSTAMAEGLDPEEVLEIMNGAFDLLIEPVYRHEGTLARLMGDAVLAFFGAPLAHEDDPERAIRAALEILAGARRYAERLERERGLSGFNVRAGIHTGLVVVGEVGSDLRVEYTAMGDAINLAARMEQNAPPGGILITHDTYRHVRGVFDVTAQPPLLVKGRAEPVQTYLVQRAKERAFRMPLRGVEGVETRMVGREAELKHLQEAFHAAMEDGELQVGDGHGRRGRRQVAPAARVRPVGRAAAPAVLLLQGAGRAGDAEPALRPAARPGRLPLPDPGQRPGRGGAPRSWKRAWPRRWVAGEEAHRSAHAIGHLLGFELGQSLLPAGAVKDAQQVRDQALAALAAYFRGLAAQSPVLVLLEDLHWTDDSPWMPSTTSPRRWPRSR
jgi:class 3 adenylate cyclase